MKLFDIPGYEGKYKISESGDIISVGRFVPESGRAGRYYPERILKQQPDKDGYLGVRLCSEGTYKNFKVHRLVAMVLFLIVRNYLVLIIKMKTKVIIM